MKYRKIEETVTIIDDTTAEDDPYDSWEVRPDEKFVDELLSEGYEYEEIYDLKLDREEGILIDYNLIPHEKLRWDNKVKAMRLKMIYPPLTRYKRALEDLGIIYDSEYWG